MTDAEQAIQRCLRGPLVSRLLARVGIHAERYWLLVDLFGQLSDRGEVLDQLGRNGVALKTAAWVYAFISAVFTLLVVSGKPPLATYFWASTAMEAFLLFTLLLSEAGNSLLNPAEAPVLAHQPISGSTYAAAKLTHLVAIVVYLVPALNVVPAFAGLVLKDSRWTYPALHLLGALGLGLLAALLCCAFYGWLIRFVPATRLKAAGQFAATVPILVLAVSGPMAAHLRRSGLWHWLIAQQTTRWALIPAGCMISTAVVLFGIRSLSADHPTRISMTSHGRSRAGRRDMRGSLTSDLVARLFGGQPARAGFAFVSRMMLRDWQFRRQVAPLFIFLLLGLVPLIVKGWQVDPFSGRFTPMHVLPHVFGVLLFFVCNLLAYGADYKGASIFLLAPAGALDRFARGVYALLWLEIVVVPHLLLIPLLAWRWGPSHAGLFSAFSLAAASFYLALALRRIDGVPFTKQMDSSVGASLMPLLMLGGIVIAIAVGLQYWLVFRSATVIIVVTAVLGVGAYFLTGASLSAFAVAMRYNLGLLTTEVGTLYKEIGV